MPATRHTNGQAEDRKTYWRNHFHKMFGLGFKLTLISFVFYNSACQGILFYRITCLLYMLCMPTYLNVSSCCKNTASLRNFLSFLFNSLQLPDFSTKLQSSNFAWRKGQIAVFCKNNALQWWLQHQQTQKLHALCSEAKLQNIIKCYISAVYIVSWTKTKSQASIAAFYSGF